MKQYFATDSRPFEDFNIKIKSGQVYDLAPETAASINGLAPGILELFVPAKHRPEPKVEAPVEEEKPAAVKEEEKEAAKEEEKDEAKADKKVLKADKPVK